MLCETCQHRADSIARVIRALEDFKPTNDSDVCMVCDPAPKAECKRHPGYGHKTESRDVCRDYQPISV